MEAKGSPSLAAGRTGRRAGRGRPREPQMAGARLGRGALRRLLCGRASRGAEKSQGAGREGTRTHSSTAPTRRRQPAAPRAPWVPRATWWLGADIAASAPPALGLMHRTGPGTVKCRGEAVATAPKKDTEDQVVWMPFLILQLEMRGVGVFWEQIVIDAPSGRAPGAPSSEQPGPPILPVSPPHGSGHSSPSLLNPTPPEAGLTGVFSFSAHPPRFCAHRRCHGVF